MDAHRRVKKNYIYNSIYQIVAIFVPLVTTPYLSRILGASQIGEYAYAYSIASYFTMAIKLGIQNYGSREIAYCRDEDTEVSKTFWELYFFQMFMAVIFVGLYVIYSVFVAKNMVISLILCLFVISAGLDITWFFVGMEKFKLIALRDFEVKLLTTCGIFLFVKTETDIWKYVLLLSVGLLGSQLFLWRYLKNYIKWNKPTIQGVVWHIKPNLMLFLPTIAVSLYKSMDKIMLGMFSTTAEVGYYESSEKIIQVPIALITSLGTVMQPRMSNLLAKNENKESLNSILEMSLKFAIFLSSIISFGIMAVAKEFVPWFYGKGYEKCITLYKILLPSCLFLAFANVIRTQHLIPHKKDKQFIISLFAGAAINLIVNGLLVVSCQSIGVAIGTLAAEISVCVVQTYFVRKEINIVKNVKQCLPFIIAGLGMYWICTAMNMISVTMPWSLLVKAGVGGISYGVILLFIMFVKKVFLIIKNRNVQNHIEGKCKDEKNSRRN